MLKPNSRTAQKQIKLGAATRRSYLPGSRTSSKATLFRRWGAHCDAAPGLTVSVDHGGKLSERIEIK
ncbi:MAG: hypothetical protein WA081_07805 [Desulfosalsimonadaceae bacterium]